MRESKTELLFTVESSMVTDVRKGPVLLPTVEFMMNVSLMLLKRSVDACA